MSVLFKNLRNNALGSWDEVIQRFLRGQDITPAGSPTIDSTSALSFSVVFACCKVLAETFCSVPLQEYRKLPNGDREQTNDTGLLDKLKYTPNDEMSGFDWSEMGMNQLNLGGNFVSKRLFSRSGKTVGFRPQLWENVKIGRDSNGILEYKIRGADDSERTYRRNEIFHVKNMSLDGITGLTPIQYAANAINLGKQYEKFGTEFYKNGLMSPGFFEHPGHLNAEAYQRLKTALAEEWAGVKNAGKAMLLEDGMKYNGLTMKLVDAELLSSKRFQIEDICRFYRVPLHLVQELTRSTNNNIEHQSLEFVMYTMLPIFKRWESSFNSQLLDANQRNQGYYFEYNIAGLLRGDQKSMAEAFAIGRQWGYLSVNDIRRMLNMNRIENGDIYLEPLNMKEAGTQPDNRMTDAMQNLIEQSRSING